MAEATSRELLNKGLSSMGICLAPAAEERLLAYCAELLKWSSRINLIAKAPLAQVWETHFFDSLTLLPLLSASPLADIGTGAGFPGLVLKIARPELQVILVEPRQKRVSFLRQVIRALGLKEVEVLCGRLEPNNPQIAGQNVSAPLVTSRAFTAIPEFLLHAEAINPAGGRVICMKGPKAEEEIAAWQRAQPQSPYRLVEISTATLPFSGMVRRLVVFEKR
ncbi:16S rRNA (guanine(527)-N(7))-methyltransferase RsmG [Thiovibrio sp. JS02]